MLSYDLRVFYIKYVLIKTYYKKGEKLSYEQSLKILENLNNKFSKSEMNESDTRFQIIDKIIKNVFYWPDSGIKTESHTNEGYTDYQLQDKDKPYIVIEAKKEKIKFNFSEYNEVRNRKIKVKVLMKDNNTKKLYYK